MNFLGFVLSLVVSTFVLFTGASFVSAGFSFQGTLLEVICWSFVTGLLLAVCSWIAAAIVTAMFSLASTGLVLGFVIGTSASAAVLFGLSYLLPVTFAIPDLYSAFIAGASGWLVLLILGALIGTVTFAGEMLPKRRSK